MAKDRPASPAHRRHQSSNIPICSPCPPWHSRAQELLLLTSKQGVPTFIGHLSAGFQVHFGVSLCSHSVDLVTQIVAAVLAAAEAKALLEGLLCVAAVGHAGLFLIQERVDEEVDGSFMGALHQLIHILKE